MVEGARDLSGVSFMRPLVPFMGPHPLWPDHPRGHVGSYLSNWTKSACVSEHEGIKGKDFQTCREGRNRNESPVSEFLRVAHGQLERDGTRPVWVTLRFFKMKKYHGGPYTGGGTDKKQDNSCQHKLIVTKKEGKVRSSNTLTLGVSEFEGEYESVINFWPLPRSFFCFNAFTEM